MKNKIILFLMLIFITTVMSACNIDNNEKNNETQLESGNKLEEIIDNTELSGEKVSNTEIKEKEDNLANNTAVNTETETQTISVDATALSNKVCAWGFRRMKDEVRPEFTASYTKPLDDYDGIYCGNPDEKVMYLTFDEGYENGYTTTILDTLKDKEISATFFVTMPYVKQNPDLVRRMIDEGHIVGNHTVNHPSMPEVTNDEKLKKEITELHDYIKDNFNYEMEFLRPPKGEYSERTVAISKELGYKTVLWSSAYADWDVKNQKGTEYAKGMILNYLHNGCVMLLHAVSKDNDAVLGDVIEEIENRGYEIRPLTEFE